MNSFPINISPNNILVFFLQMLADRCFCSCLIIRTQCTTVNNAFVNWIVRVKLANSWKRSFTLVTLELFDPEMMLKELFSILDRVSRRISKAIYLKTLFLEMDFVIAWDNITKVAILTLINMVVMNTQMSLQSTRPRKAWTTIYHRAFVFESSF